MNGVFIIPTGIGCAIGGHAGDAVCAVNLIASQCDNLIVNPNAVNASDINEMAANCLYVEGSFIDRFLQGRFGLKKNRRNRIMLAVNAPASPHTINSANAAIISLGVDVAIMETETPLVLTAGWENDGTAGGEVAGWEELVSQCRNADWSFDVLAIQTSIDVSDSVVERYLTHGGVNPWGGVEAKLSRLVSGELDKPVAHAPQQREDDYFRDYQGVPDPRMSAEMVSVSYLHCVLKGLARAPTIGDDLRVSDIDFLITPDDCYGLPHKECYWKGIEVIVVRENTSVLGIPFSEGGTFVENYLEAAGLIACRKIGINERRVRADA